MFAAIVRGMENEHQQPWGKVIDEARRRAGLSARKAAEQAGISEGRWRQIVNGYQPAGRGQVVTVEGPDDTVARMAQAVGVSPAELRKAGRERAAVVLEGLLQPITAEDAKAVREALTGMLDPRLGGFTDAELLQEIQTRMLFMAARLHAAGDTALDWALDQEGLLEMVSRTGG